MELPVSVAIVLGAYILGGLPPGVLLGKLLRGVDIREHGSGKTGATNVQRTLGWGPAGLTFGLDVGKGAAAVLLAGVLVGRLAVPLPDLTVALAGVAAVAGHNWPLLMGGHGGRGISPAVGASLALAPWAVAPALLAAAVVIVLTDTVSLGSLAGTLLGLALFGAGSLLGWLPTSWLAFAVPAAVLLVYSHHDNLGRILRGQERRLGLRSRVVPAEEPRTA